MFFFFTVRTKTVAKMEIDRWQTSSEYWFFCFILIPPYVKAFKQPESLVIWQNLLFVPWQGYLIEPTPRKKCNFLSQIPSKHK